MQVLKCLQFFVYSKTKVNIHRVLCSQDSLKR